MTGISRTAAIATLALTGLVFAAPSAAAGPVQFEDATASLTDRGGKALQPGPKGPAGRGSSARREIPLLTPDPAKLRRAKARAAEDLPGGPSQAPRQLSPLPKASVFGGLNEPGMAAAGDRTPPDTTGAIGPSHYVEFVNGTGITAYDRELNPVSGPVALQDFIGFPEDSVFDPQIQWDDDWGRWIYVMDDVEGPEDNFLAFGWSKTADPSNLTTEFPGEGAGAGWCEYFIGTGELFDDYPKLGHSDVGITIGTNVFSPEGFVGSRLWSITKPASPQTCPELPLGSIGATELPLETEDGDTALTPVPANTADSSLDSYVVAADSPFFTADSEIMAWHISGAGEAATLVEDGNMEVGSYEIPASVPQEGTPEVLDTLDTRLTNAVAVTDPAVGEEAVWTQHTIDGPEGRSVVRWYELLPGAGPPSVRQEGEIADPEHFVFNGAISPTAQGDAAAINFNRGSGSLFPEMHAQSREPETPLGQMEGDVLLGESAGAAEDFSCDIAEEEPCRWGDYAGASPDHSAAGVVWGSNQGLAAPSGELARWTTRNFALRAAPPPPAPPEPPDDDDDGDGDGDGDSSASSPPPAPPPLSPPLLPGIAKAGGFGLVLPNGKALLRMHCLGPGGCNGAFRLIARVKTVRGKRNAKGRRRGARVSRRARRRVRNVVVGRTGFAIAPGQRRVVRVGLNRRGRVLIRRAGRRGLRVLLRGKGVRKRAVKLKPKPRRAKKGKRRGRR